MNIYELFEGHDQESCVTTLVSHEKLFTTEEFEIIFTGARMHADATRGHKHLGPDLIAESMCKLYGFKKFEPVITRYIGV